MARASPFLERNRFAIAAIGISAAVHAAVFVGMPQRIAAIDEKAAAIYSATLDPAAVVAPAPKAQPAPAAVKPAPKPRRVARAKAPSPPRSPAAEVAPIRTVALADGILAPLPGATMSDAMAAKAPPESAPPSAANEPEPMLAAAEALAPTPLVEPAFPMQAFPPNVSIAYHLSSSFADGNAVYSWEREGNNYRITGEAEAEGFFALFLEGRIQQESRGTVTEAGLRPERFLEQRPNNVSEGLEFDWAAREVTFSRGGKSNRSPLADNTVDWLSMIFQLAHLPPKGQSMQIQVFTQRKMYRYRLEVLGVEDIEIPIGKVRGLHLRHVDEKDATEIVDVWLGIDQHYLPVKLRFPVARNRLMVEQVATRVSER